MPGWEFDSTTMRIAVVLFFALLAACLALVVLLITLRIVNDLRDRQRARRAAELRTVFFQFVMGEPREALEAERLLLGMNPRHWKFARAQAFAMLPKLRGESRDHLIRLLRDKGSMEVALQQVRSLSMVRRCRGAFALGALQDKGHADVLIELLADHAFLVRRVTVRALGNLGAPEAVGPLLELAREEPRLSRDLVYALYRIGPDGAPAMREHLESALASGGADRSADLVATALGTLADFRSRSILMAGLRSDRAELAAACADALGAISAPDTESALVVALTHPSAQVREAAARALGSLGSAAAVEPLARLVDEHDRTASREAASALVRIGPAGRARLEQSESEFAVEALALAGLRGGR